MKEKEKCPYCYKYFVDVLTHMATIHEVGSLEEIEKKLGHNKIEDQKKEKFRKFVTELSEKHRKQEISGEAYRNAIKQWYEQEMWKE